MYLLRFTILRFVQMLPVLIGITLCVFLLLRVMPGDPATLILGRRGTAEDIARLSAQLGLDRPIWEQYLLFLWDIAKGSLGQSIAYRSPVSFIIMERLPATLLLVAYSTILTVLVTVPLAIFVAMRKDRPADLLVKSLFVVLMSLPPFWLGILLILLFSIKLHWFPVSGYGSNIIENIWYLFLPALVIALATSALTIRSLRSSIIAVATADYVDTARAKGLKPGAVMRRHILRNSLVSTVSVLAVHTSWIIGGTVVVESVFAVPGLGYLLVSSIFTRDYPMVQGLTVTFAMLVVLISLLTDIAYALIDPRVRYD